MSLTLKDLRVEIPRSIVDAVNNETLTRKATVADLVEVLKAEGAETRHFGPKTAGEYRFDRPGLYLVLPLDGDA